MKYLRAVQILLLGTIVSFGVVMEFNHADAQSASTVIVNGLPMKKVMSDIEGTEAVAVPEKERFSYKLLITKKDNKYIWTSRGNRDLSFNQDGSFYDFVEPNGRGYIRVSITDGTCLYMEHLTLGFKNITYWGIGEECNLK